MFNPLLAILAFILLDFVISYFSKKETDKDTTPSNKPVRKKNALFDLIANFEERINESINQEPRKTQDQQSMEPVRREGTRSQKREDLIRQQDAKIMKHSDMEKSRRLEREQLLKTSRLSESQIPLAMQDPKKRMQDYDLDQRKASMIQTSQAIKQDFQRDGNRQFDIQNDLVKAIIYSEILGKPKSLENK